jgi:hypothetical protein
MKMRSLLIVLMLLVAAAAGTAWPAADPATAQDGDIPGAALVEGTCDDPGATTAPLNELTVRDGGEVLVSLTILDLALDAITGDEHAIVLTDGDAVIACGDVVGGGNDVYVDVAGTGDAGWGGIAWLRVRGDGTQVSLYVARGLGGGSVSPGPTEEPGPQPPDDETPTPTEEPGPQPPDDETPTPTTDGMETYTSPSYGYTLTYDPEVWEKTREVTNPTDSGPLDVLGLDNRTSLVTLVGEAGVEGFDARQLCEVRLRQYSEDPQVSDLVVREEVDGDESRATVEFDYTYTTDDGDEYDWTVWVDCFNAPDNSTLLSFFFSSPPESADEQATAREDLLAGLTFPGSGEPGPAPTEEAPQPPDDETPEATEEAPQPPDDETPTPTEEAPLPPEDETPTATEEPGPLPPGDETPEPTRSSEGMETYTSPSFGYTLTYDPDVWDKTRDESEPTEFGPLDVLGLDNGVSSAALVGEQGADDFNALLMCEVRVEQHTTDPQVSGVTIVEEADGDANRASVVFEYTYTTDSGREYDWHVWIDCFNAPDNSVLLSVIISAPPDEAEEQAAARDELLAGLTFPGE